MGRPKEENSRSGRLSFRVNSEETDMVERLCVKYDDTPSEVMRRALRYLYISEKHGLLGR